MLGAVGRGISGFARFWYHLIIGDDWSEAAAVAVGMVGTWLLLRAHLAAWWLLPVVVVVITGVSLRRTRARARPAPPSRLDADRRQEPPRALDERPVGVAEGGGR